MESLAPPGTEDHVVAASGSGMFVSKKNTETDRLLAQRYTLPDGSTASVFELSWQNGSEVWYCRVCHCPVMGQVFTHEAGKRHVSALDAANNVRSNSTVPPWKKPVGKQAPVTAAPDVRIAPGEPVPPGFEGEITKVAQIQERLDAFKRSSLVGLEYLLELQDYDREPTYLCLLCGKKGDSRTIIPHLVSYNHLHYYFHRHYRTTYNALLPFSTHKIYKKCYQDCLTKIASAIESKYGRMLPHPIDVDTYERNKQEVYDKVNNGPHFSESNGVTFEHLVDVEEIKRVSNNTYMESMNRNQERSLTGITKSSPRERDRYDCKPRNGRRSLSSVSSISSDDFDYTSGHQSRSSRSTKPSSSSGLYNRRRRSRTRSRSRGRSPSYRTRGEDSLPWNRPDYRRNDSTSKDQRGGSDRDRDRERDRERDRDRDSSSKRDEFRRLAAAIETDMERQLRQHQINPEKHPQYNDEWKIFWNKRYKELLDEGKNAQGYDFKPEWIIYWNKKMEEFHKSSVKQEIDALRRRLGLAEVAPISFKINSASTLPSSFARRRETGKTACQPIAAQPDQDHEVIVIDDSRDDHKKSRDRSHSPWETESNSTRKDMRRREPMRRRSTSRSRSRSLSPYRRRYSGRRRSTSRSRSRSSSRSKGDRYKYSKRSTRSRSKSPFSRSQVESNKSQTSRRSAEWDRSISYKSKNQPAISFSPSGKDVIMIRESTLKKQENLDEQLTAVADLGADVNIVAVLRLLTALEDKLGSLGPKVIDLLAQALCMEKKAPNSSEQLLDNEANCVMFETIKEKLKGLLHAGLVMGFPSQEKAVQTSITKIAGLLHMANKRKEEKDAKRTAVISIDRVAIAKQLANALVLQGKDVSQADLEQLITAVVSMAEASKDSAEPITTAAFLERLKPTPTVEVKPPEKQKEPEVEITTASNISAKDAIDGLSDLELQTLLQSFKDLSAEEQHGLISYLKKLEAIDPTRVETLRKYVNVDVYTSIPSVNTSVKSEVENSGTDMNARKFSESTPTTEKLEAKSTIGISDDEDDYSYEDVFKAASKNLSEKEQQKPPQKQLPADNNVSNLFTNILDTISARPNVPSVSINTSPPPIVNAPATTVAVPSNMQQTSVATSGYAYTNGGNNQQGGYGGQQGNYSTWQQNQRGPGPQHQYFNRQFSSQPPMQQRPPYQQMPPNMQNSLMQPQQRFYPNKGDTISTRHGSINNTSMTLVDNTQASTIEESKMDHTPAPSNGYALRNGGDVQNISTSPSSGPNSSMVFGENASESTEDSNMQHATAPTNGYRCRNGGIECDNKTVQIMAFARSTTSINSLLTPLDNAVGSIIQDTPSPTPGYAYRNGGNSQEEVFVRHEGNAYIEDISARPSASNSAKSPRVPGDATMDNASAPAFGFAYMIEGNNQQESYMDEQAAICPRTAANSNSAMLPFVNTSVPLSEYTRNDGNNQQGEFMDLQNNTNIQNSISVRSNGSINSSMTSFVNTPTFTPAEGLNVEQPLPRSPGYPFRIAANNQRRGYMSPQGNSNIHYTLSPRLNINPVTGAEVPTMQGTPLRRLGYPFRNGGNIQHGSFMGQYGNQNLQNTISGRPGVSINSSISPSFNTRAMASNMQNRPLPRPGCPYRNGGNNQQDAFFGRSRHNFQSTPVSLCMDSGNNPWGGPIGQHGNQNIPNGFSSSPTANFASFDNMQSGRATGFSYSNGRNQNWGSTVQFAGQQGNRNMWQQSQCGPAPRQPRQNNNRHLSQRPAMQQPRRQPFE